MDPNEFPTKGNLIKAKNTLSMSRLGYDLLDKKRNVLIHEIMELNKQALDIQSKIEETFADAYRSLQIANIEMGISNVELISYGIPQDESITMKIRSTMGVEIPIISYDDSNLSSPHFGFAATTTSLDEAYIKFKKVKDLTIKLSMIETAAYRLAIAIKKTQRRANALKNVTIPKFEALTAFIQSTLEERERDEFTRLKVIKKKYI